MIRNESNLDRTLRAIVGAILLIAWIAGWLGGACAIVLGIVGVILLLSAAVGFCPLYKLLGVSTAQPATEKA
jgi:hypothetical protein